MNIQLMTMWYNEEFLAPYFLKHYSWVNKIHILLDADTNDNTESVAKQFSNVEIEHFKFPDMMDDILKVQVFNNKYKTLTDADYVILADSDEFIFCNDLNKTVRSHIENTVKDVYFVNLWQIYENENDLPMSSDVPVPYLRRHGDPNMEDSFNILYVKPAIVKGNKDIHWNVGNHDLVYNGNRLKWMGRDIEVMESLNVSCVRNEMLQGSHWKLFNLQETINRRIHNRKNRQSKVNLKYSLTIQHHNITEEEIRAEYDKNKNRPIVILSNSVADSDSTHSNSNDADYGELVNSSVSRTKLKAEGKQNSGSSTKSLDLGCGVQPMNPFKADEIFGVNVLGGISTNIRKADLSVESIPFDNQTFEYVTAIDFLDKIPKIIYSPSRRNAFIELMNEIYRVLKPGGVFLCITPVYPYLQAFQDPTQVSVITETTFPLYFDHKNGSASKYGFNGEFSLLSQEKFGEQNEKLFIQLRKV